MAKPRLLLADDHELLLDGLRRLLEVDFELVGAVDDGRQAVALFEQLRPDVLLLDIGMPGLNGMEATRQVRRAFPDARIIFVTMQTDRVYLEEAFRAGASGYVVKQAAARELIDAIRTVLRGRRYVSPRLMEAMGGATPFEGGDESLPHFGGKLTPRQREVLQLVAEGKSMKEIARLLDISVRTVEFHKNGLIQQLGLRTVAELTRYALDQKIAV
ncbi:MAG TPA: response regulator transcription factor [Bryobacteraceae bacterium]|jgi:DNA-binding NarL/FixJ family response regulator|nr:response regulator transcription factor [Bryobacteraceae bacterium]